MAGYLELSALSQRWRARDVRYASTAHSMKYVLE